MKKIKTIIRNSFKDYHEEPSFQGGCAASPLFLSPSFLAICWKLGKPGDVLNRLDARVEMREYPRIPVSGGPQSVQ